jgi:hypothetical protein
MSTLKMNQIGTEDLSTQDEDEKSSFTGSSPNDLEDGPGTKDSNEFKGESTQGDESSSTDDHLAFGKKENSRVRRSKIFVVIFLVLLAITACLTVYFVVDNNETSEFNST